MSQMLAPQEELAIDDETRDAKHADRLGPAADPIELSLPSPAE